MFDEMAVKRTSRRFVRRNYYLNKPSEQFLPRRVQNVYGPFLLVNLPYAPFFSSPVLAASQIPANINTAPIIFTHPGCSCKIK